MMTMVAFWVNCAWPGRLTLMLVFVSLSTCLMFLPSLPITNPVWSPGMRKARPLKGLSEDSSEGISSCSAVEQINVGTFNNLMAASVHHKISDMYTIMVGGA